MVFPLLASRTVAKHHHRKTHHKHYQPTASPLILLPSSYPEQPPPSGRVQGKPHLASPPRVPVRAAAAVEGHLYASRRSSAAPCVQVVFIGAPACHSLVDGDSRDWKREGGRVKGVKIGE